MSERQDRELQRFFDGELSPRQARKVAERLTQDADELRRLEALEEMQLALRGATEDAADEANFTNLWARVQQGVEADKEARAGGFAGRWLLRWGVALASAAAAVVLAIVLLNPAHTPRVRNDCVIESLEVEAGATSTIFTIDDPEVADATTVIWVDEAQQGD